MVVSQKVQNGFLDFCHQETKLVGKLTVRPVRATRARAPGGLVHLTEDKGDLGLALEVDDTSLLHFVVQVVTLTSTLADTAEHGVTTVGLGDVVLEMCQLEVLHNNLRRYSRSAPE